MIKLRRTLVGVLFDKMARLSSKSMTETNSGKLISLVSADLFEAERGTAFVNIFLASPLLNFICYGFLVSSIGWAYTLVVFACWIALTLCQWLAGTYYKQHRMAMGGLTDKRLDVVNDLIVGCRTIKCYGWEKHYIERIGDLRRKSLPHVFWMDMIGALGSSFFQNFGMIAILIIILCEWGRGRKLETEIIMSALAMVYVLFFQVNVSAFFGLSSFFSFLAILQRLASVLALEESDNKKETNVASNEATIELDGAAFGWGFRISED